jgi:hypothetical protein
LLDGYVENVRITNGVARYRDISFTPETVYYPVQTEVTPVVSDMGHVIAQLQMEDPAADTTPVDVSIYGGTWTCTGTGVDIDRTLYRYGVGCLGPIAGTTGRCTVNDSSLYTMLAEDFSIEMDVRFITAAGTNGHTFVGDWGTPSNAAMLWYWDSATEEMRFEYTTDGLVANLSRISADWVPAADRWYHLAICRNGGDLRFFVDGVQLGATGSMSTDSIYNSTRQKHIGFSNVSNKAVSNMYVDNFRWIKGEAIYTAAFTAPFKAHAVPQVTVAQLSFEGTDGDSTTTDSSAVGALRAAPALKGTAVIDDARAKDGSTSCLGATASGVQIDATQHADFNHGTADFTYEAWFYSENPVGNNQMLFMNGNGVNAAAMGMYIWLDSSANLEAKFSNGTTVYSSALASGWTADTWYHVAYVRDGDNVRVYLDGVEHFNFACGTGASMNQAPSAYVTVGCWTSNGSVYSNSIESNIDMVRITDYALYPDGTTFTPPTSF